MRRFLFALGLLALAGAAHAQATKGGPIPVPLPLFPPNNWWNTDVSAAPVDYNSNAFITFIGGFDRRLHPDFGGDAGDGTIFGIPYIIVDSSQPKETVTFGFDDESDGHGIPFYPIPPEAITQSGWIEGGPPGNDPVDGDRHMLIVDKTNNTLYELFDVFHNGTAWVAGSGAFFDMKTNNRRPEGWTSADAAGLAILPGLVRSDEAFGPDEIRHAFRVTVSQTNGHVYPASHTAGSTSGALPMGARLRLKADKDISMHPPYIQKIFRAFKKYGLIVADNGSNMFISGVYDTNWNNDELNPAFRSLRATDFEVVQLGWAPPVSFILTIPTTLGAGDATDATLTAYDPNYNVATGYTGTVQFTSTDGAATLPVNYTFAAGDGGTHMFPAGFILRTAGSHVITVTDVANATITGSRGVTVGPATPTSLSATASSLTSVNVTWNPSTGATQYEVFRDGVAIGTTPGSTYPDSALTPGTTYVYRVRAIDSALRPSPLSAPDAATTIAFTDDPVVAGITTIKAVHLSEVRQGVNAMRVKAGLAAASFTDGSLTGVPLKAVHVQEIRNAVAEARAALALATLAFTDAVLTPGVTGMKAAHVEELRSSIR